MADATGVDPRIYAGLHGKYEVGREIGAGGMGTVYLARDLKHNREVAIKVIRSEMVSAATMERFAKEILTVAQLAHPGILPVYDSGSVNDILYYVTPLVEGGSLRSILAKQTQLPIEQSLAIACDIGHAVGYAHSRGIVHRDLKPENVLLQEGRTLVADFGLALTMESEGGPTDSGLIAGSAIYMAPEQGASDQVDGRADVYALGVMLYEMLAGTPPFPGARAQSILTRKMIGHVPPLRDVRPQVPRPVERAISKALSPVPADRFATMGEFVRALRPQPESRLRVYAAGLVAMVLILGGGSYAYTHEVTLDPGTVIVDEFTNQTGSPSLGGIGAALSDWTAEGLQGTRLKQVVPTPTALQASRFVRQAGLRTPDANPIALLARETGAGIVVSGAYYTSGDRLTFLAQVSDVSSGFLERLLRREPRVRLRATLSPLSVSRDSVEIAIAEVRARVMGAFSVARSVTEFSAPELLVPPPTFESYDTFASAMSAYISNEGQKAVSLFLQSYSLDTTFTVSLLYAALALSNTGQFAREDSLLRIVARSPSGLNSYHRLWLQYRQALLAGNRKTALRAVRSLAAEAPRSKATYNLAIEAWEDGHLEEARAALRSLRPDLGPVRDFLPYWGALANVEHLLGNYREALAVSVRAREAHRDRLWPISWELGALAALGRTDEVMTRARNIEQRPRDDMGLSAGEILREASVELRAHGCAKCAETIGQSALRAYVVSARRGDLTIRDRLGIAATLYGLGRVGEARSAYTALSLELPGDVQVVGQLGCIAASVGDSATARAVIARLQRDRTPYQFGEPAFQAARIAAVLGEDNLALQLLGDALAQGQAYGQWIHADPAFEKLRGAPAFVRLTRAVTLAAER